MGDFNISKELVLEEMERAATVYAVAQVKGITLTNDEQSNVLRNKSGFIAQFGSQSDYEN